MMKSVLIIIKTPPYGSVPSREAIDVAFAAATFDRHTEVVFLNEGVLNLLNSDSGDLPVKDISKIIASMPMYGIEQMYFDADFCTDLGIQSPQIFEQAQPISRENVQQKMQDFDQVWVF